MWASKYNERALLSMKKVGLDFRDLRMAVLVQRVVPAAYAFVIHTDNPTNGSPDEVFCELVLGLGESIVSGMVPGSSLAFVTRKDDLDNPKVSTQPVMKPRNVACSWCAGITLFGVVPGLFHREFWPNKTVLCMVWVCHANSHACARCMPQWGPYKFYDEEDRGFTDGTSVGRRSLCIHPRVRECLSLSHSSSVVTATARTWKGMQELACMTPSPWIPPFSRRWTMAMTGGTLSAA